MTTGIRENAEAVEWNICLRCGHDMEDLLDMSDTSCGCDCHYQLEKDIKDDGEVDLLFPDGTALNVTIEEYHYVLEKGRNEN